jgi:hypothetical protein
MAGNAVGEVQLASGVHSLHWAAAKKGSAKRASNTRCFIVESVLVSVSNVRQRREYTANPEHPSFERQVLYVRRSAR